MKYLAAFMILVFAFALAGCAAPGGLATPTSLPQPTVAAVEVVPAQPGSADAAAIGKRLLEVEGFTWVGSPEAVLAEQMTYAEAAQKIPPMRDEAPHNPLWPDGRVWLVILRGQWDLVPMGPPGAPPNRYQGCIMVLFTAADNQVVAAGDTLCP